MMRLVHGITSLRTGLAASVALAIAIGAEPSSAQLLEDEQRYDGEIPILRQIEDLGNDPSLFVSNDDLAQAPLSATPEPTSAVLLIGAAAALLTSRQRRNR